MQHQIVNKHACTKDRQLGTRNGTKHVPNRKYRIQVRANGAPTRPQGKIMMTKRRKWQFDDEENWETGAQGRNIFGQKMTKVPKWSQCTFQRGRQNCSNIDPKSTRILMDSESDFVAVGFGSTAEPRYHQNRIAHRTPILW